MPTRNRLLLDMDGVITDFQRCSLREHLIEATYPQITCWEFPKLFGFADAWDPRFWSPLDRSFWSSLGWTPEGDHLLCELEYAFGPENVYLVTTPVDFPTGCRDGKMDWIRAKAPSYARRHAMTAAKEMSASPGTVLLDDKDENVESFRAAGGPAILVPRPWNSRRAECDSGGLFDVGSLVREAVLASRSEAAGTVS